MADREFRGGQRGRGSFPRGRGSGTSGGTGYQQGGGLPFRPQQGGERGGGAAGRGRGGGGGGDGAGRGAGGTGRGAGRGGSPQVFSHQAFATPLPDEDVTKVEDAYQKDVASQISTVAKETTFPPRPGYGTRGENVTLWANYFHLVPTSVGKNTVLFRYNIAITPVVQGVKKTKRVVQLLLESPSFSQLRNDLVTDYRATLISRATLDASLLDNRITYIHDEEDEPRENAVVYHVIVTPTGTLAVSLLLDYLCSTNSNAVFPQKSDTIQALNIILAHHRKSDPLTATIGRNRFYSFGPGDAKYSLGSGLEALRGYFTSVRAATNRLLVNINVSHGVFYEPIRLDLLMNKFAYTYGKNPIRVERFLKRIRITTTHLPEKKNRKGAIIPRVKVISGLAHVEDGQRLENPPRINIFAAGPKNVFFHIGSRASSKSTDSAKADPESATKKKGKGRGSKGGIPKGKENTPKGQSPEDQYISVYEFFRSVHKRTVADPEIPVVNVGTAENPSYLPAEVCMVLPGQNSLAKLDPKQTAQMIRFAVRKPYENANTLVVDGAASIGISPHTNEALSTFGINIDARMIIVPGRVLTQPPVRYRTERVNPGKDEKLIYSREGGWNMTQCKFNTGSVISNWGCLWISTNIAADISNRTYFDEAIAGFQRTLVRLGITVGAPCVRKQVALSGGSDDDESLEETFKATIDNPGKPDLLLVILPAANSPVYNRIKILGDIKYGIHTICSVGSKFIAKSPAGSNDQYFTNVALKFNLKKGGLNQLLDPSRLGLISEDKTMLVGIDVTHPSPGSSSSAPSIAGMVASIDKLLGQWPAELRIQAARQERVSELDEMLRSRLSLWRTLGKHKDLPDNILVYRDGVSEGQYDMVIENELPLLRKACQEVYSATQTKQGLPHISIVVVGKRHHTRFYPTKVENASKSSNPLNGTVVDRGVTEKSNWDFFLQAHSALQGTARPAHYYVVCDEIFSSRRVKPPHQNAADTLEELTHNLCYLYGRATKAVSICPAAYYADLVCERARCYLSGLFTGVTSSQGSIFGGAQQEAQDEDIRVHANLRNTMFYL